MCDTMVVAEPGRVWFAKNSDRDPNEAQFLEWRGPASYPAGAQVRCTHIAIPQVRETCAVLLSRPFWMWGAEIGTNEHGVCAGNEAVFTNQPYAPPGLLGMDLLRLALERADSAARAVSVMTDLLEAHGQGGGCGLENPRFTYHNSFIVADPHEAYVLETAGRRWATERVTRGARTISNGLTIPDFAAAHSDRIKTRVSACRIRQARTTGLIRSGMDAVGWFRVLRDHGGHPFPRYAWLNGGMSAPCMHAGGIAASSQTTASWVAELTPHGARHWVTATAAPCTSLFKPVSVERPLDLGAPPSERAGDHLWWKHEAFHRLVMRDPAAAFPCFAEERGALEREWIAAPPDSAEAFAAHARCIERWLPRVRAAVTRDTRPWWVRRYARRRARWAGLDR